MPQFTGAGRGGTGMVSFVIRTDFRRPRQALKTFERKMGSRRVPLKECAIDYMSRTVIKKRFQQSGPGWKKHAPATIKRHGQHRLLKLSHNLLESVTGGRNFFIRYEPNRNPHTVLFGSTLDYAIAHDQPRGTYFNTGKSEIPGRPWSYVTQNNADYMLGIFMNWAGKKLKESGFIKRR